MTTENDEILNELKTLSQLFISADEDMRTGKDVDMTGIDERIAAVCASIEDAPEDKRDEYGPALNELLKFLNTCEVTMKTLENS